MSVVKLGDICEFKYGSSLPAAKRIEGSFDVYGSNGIVGTHDEALTTGPTIVIGRKGSIGEVNYSATPAGQSTRPTL
jgi:type I restriction enzyme S subunit